MENQNEQNNNEQDEAEKDLLELADISTDKQLDDIKTGKIKCKESKPEKI